jgi:hypothetical protein
VDIIINNETPGIELGHGDTGFILQCLDNFSKFGIFFYDSEGTKTGDMPNIKENATPYFALTFTNVESLDVVISGLTQLKTHVLNGWKDETT